LAEATELMLRPATSVAHEKAACRGLEDILRVRALAGKISAKGRRKGASQGA